jgi:pimeloyl-ACP methyl ester carboxylesterase
MSSRNGLFHYKRSAVALISLLVLAVVPGCRNAELRSEPPVIPPPNYKFATVNHHNIGYVDTGSGDVLVLVHGFGGSTYSWRNVIRAQASKYRVIALDLPGFGFSDKPVNDPQLYAHQQQAATVAAFLDTLKVDQVSIAGHSMGGAVALLFALQYPQRVRNLILVDAAVRDKPGPSAPPIALFVQKLPGVSAAVSRAFASRKNGEKMLRSALYRKEVATPALLEGYVTPNMYHLSSKLMMAVSEARSSATKPRLGEIRAPTLIIWGQHDPWISIKTAYVLQKGIVGSKLVVSPVSGHLPQEEDVDLFNHAMTSFLAE